MREPSEPATGQSVVERYGELARAVNEGRYVVDCDPQAFADGYFGSVAYRDTAELPDGAVRASLGCGNPVAVAELRPGETVLDLGSGGGIDVLLSARRVGPTGKAYGVDATPEMVELARAHAAQSADNVEFRLGVIEDLPLPDEHVDVVISNCVINLTADKARVLTEAYRVLRPGGRLGVSDVIAGDRVDPRQRASAERRTGCLGGTLTAGEYRQLLAAAGFTDIRVEPTIEAGGGLTSAIVRARKPPG